MTPLAGRTFGIVGALVGASRGGWRRGRSSAQGGQLRRGVTAATTALVVFGRALLDAAATASDRARGSTRRGRRARTLRSENGFLRLLGRAGAGGAGGVGAGGAARRSRGSASGDFDLLALFDAFEQRRASPSRSAT